MGNCCSTASNSDDFTKKPLLSKIEEPKVITPKPTEVRVKIKKNYLFSFFLLLLFFFFIHKIFRKKFML